MTEDKDAQPILEVIDGNNHYRIFADGRVEGFSDEAIFVINNIPALMDSGLYWRLTDLNSERSLNTCGERITP